jgi:hypothetical protein
LSTALDAIPIQILSCEEGLLSGILLANTNQIKSVKDLETKNTFLLPQACEKVMGESKKRLELLELHADYSETLLN